MSVVDGLLYEDIREGEMAVAILAELFVYLVIVQGGLGHGAGWGDGRIGYEE